MLSTRTGLSPTMACLSRQFRFLSNGHWPSPRSLATTNGVSVDVLSSGYLDVSVRRVCFAILCIQITMTLTGGFPHSEIHGSKVAHISPQLIAACHVLHRLSVPRHPPNALQRLITTHRHVQGKPRDTFINTHETLDNYRSENALPTVPVRRQTQQGVRPTRYPPFKVVRTTSDIHNNKVATVRLVLQTGAMDVQRKRALLKAYSTISFSHRVIFIDHTNASLPPHWWRRTGSNRRPPACKAGALPTELRPFPEQRPENGGPG